MQKIGELTGRSAIITGSGRNIGKAIAKRLALSGANVVINGRDDQAGLEEVVKEIETEGGTAVALRADVSDPDSVERLVEETRRAFGSVDIAVSNVAVRPTQRFLDITVADWHSVLNTNLNAAFYMARAVLPLMKQQGWGRLVHVSGADGFHANSTTRAHNIVAKAGVHALTRVLSNEFSPCGIRVNTLAPGPTETERQWTPELIASMNETRSRIPMGRFGTVDEIADACLFLVSDASRFVTGQVLHVNGGDSTFSS